MSIIPHIAQSEQGWEKPVDEGPIAEHGVELAVEGLPFEIRGKHVDAEPLQRGRLRKQIRGRDLYLPFVYLSWIPEESMTCEGISPLPCEFVVDSEGIHDLRGHQPAALCIYDELQRNPQQMRIGELPCKETGRNL